jgi:uncharacterized phiE125 gp8 family phage protein
MTLLVTLITAAAVQPVSVAECKSDLRIDVANEDDLISDYIDAAARYCSEVTGRKLISQTWKYGIGNEPGKFVATPFKPVFNSFQPIELPFNPVSAIVEVQYFDADNVSQVLNLADFYLYNYQWPPFYERRDALNITFTTGYGATGADVPSNIKRAIRLLVAHWYEQRMAVTVGQSAMPIPFGVDAMLNVDRTGWVA